MHGFHHQDTPFYDFQVPGPTARVDLLDMNNFPYFGSETFNSPYYSQSTADWSPSCIDPSATQPPWVEALHSPPYLNPSRTTPSSHSDSEHSLSFRCSPSAASAAARLSPTPQLPIEGRRAKVTAESAASPSVVRDAILHLLHSPEWEQQEEVPGDMLMPIVEAIHFPNGGRSGSRGGIDRYKCLFGTCAKVIKRRDHMLNHVRCHLGLKPWICGFISADAHKQCGTRFLRVDDLKRHLRHIHKHDMDESGTYFPVPNRVKQVRGPRKGRRAEPYPTQDASDDEYRPQGFVTRRGRTGLFGRRYGASWLGCETVCAPPRLRTPRLSCVSSEPGD